MPKEKSHKTHQNKPYTKVTSHSINRLNLFSPEDKTNLTYTIRDVDDYSKKLRLGSSLKKFIIKLAKDKGKKITILDAGCGSAVAMADLLEDEELEPYIKRIAGISLHYFEEPIDVLPGYALKIDEILKKHPARFNYYLGSAQEVLTKAKETFCAFDLILDVWGAYPYSKDKLNLLKLYYSALAPGGIAKVLDRDGQQLMIKNKSLNFLPFSKWAETTYPDIFTCVSNEYTTRASNYTDQVISIKKTSARWPLPEYQLISRSKFSTKGEEPLTRGIQARLEKGNAIRITELIELDETESHRLRSLGFVQN